MKRKNVLRYKNKTRCHKGLLLVSLFIIFLFPTWIEGQTKTAFINNPPGINLRTRPTTKGSSIITRLPYGVQVEVLAEGRSESNPKYKYYKVRTLNGQVGWVYAGDNDDWLVESRSDEIQVATEAKEGSELQDTPVKTWALFILNTEFVPPRYRDEVRKQFEAARRISGFLKEGGILLTILPQDYPKISLTRIIAKLGRYDRKSTNSRTREDMYFWKNFVIKINPESGNMLSFGFSRDFFRGFPGDEDIFDEAMKMAGGVPSVQDDGNMMEFRKKEKIQKLIEQFKYEDTRSTAIDELVEIGEQATESLTKALKDEDRLVRICATATLGLMGNKRAIWPLVESLREDKDNVVRSSAALALVKIGKPSVEPLIELLEDKDWFVRWHAAASLGDIKDARAVEPLTEVLKDKNRIVRSSAAEALEKIRRK